MEQESPVFYAAAGDHRPDLVWVNTAELRNLECPPDPGDNVITIASEDIASRPELFCAYLLVMNSLNYQFWEGAPWSGEKPQSMSSALPIRRYTRDGWVGALAMEASMLEWWRGHFLPEESDQPCIRNTLEGMREDLKVFGAKTFLGDIPALESRTAILEEMLNPRLVGAAARALTARAEISGELGWQDAAWLAQLFPKSYADPYLKKAQLALMLMAGQFREIGTPVSLDVSAAADYQLPKVLRAMGLLHYCDDLATRVDGGYPIVEGSEYERAIRAATIYAVDALAEQFKWGVEKVDHWLWSQRNVATSANFHLCATTAY